MRDVEDLAILGYDGEGSCAVTVRYVHPINSKGMNFHFGVVNAPKFVRSSDRRFPALLFDSGTYFPISALITDTRWAVLPYQPTRINLLGISNILVCLLTLIYLKFSPSSPLCPSKIINSLFYPVYLFGAAPYQHHGAH